jgi:hypothetical protein
MKILTFKMLKNFGAIDKNTRQFVLPEFADKKNSYECPDEDCRQDLIFKKGKINIPYFAHKPSSEKECHYYERPGESQIHRNAKLYLKKLLEDLIESNYNNSSNNNESNNNETSNNNDSSDPNNNSSDPNNNSSNNSIQIITKCSCGQTESIPLYLLDTKIVIEHRFKFSNSEKIADVVCLFSDKSNIKYIFEICYKHKTQDYTRPEPWFEFDARELLTTNPSGNKITLKCIRTHEYCKRCKCKGSGKCLEIYTHKKLYDCEFKCHPVKCNKCDKLINTYYDDIVKGSCFECIERETLYKKYENAKLHLKNLLETKDSNIFVNYTCKCNLSEEIKLDLHNLIGLNTNIKLDHLGRDVSVLILNNTNDNNEQKYTFDLCYKYKPLISESFTPFEFNLSVNKLLESKSTLYFDSEKKKICKKIVLPSIKKTEYCKNCKCKGNGRCLDNNKKLYDCEFKCIPDKFKNKTNKYDSSEFYCEGNRRCLDKHNKIKNKTNKYDMMFSLCEGNGRCLDENSNKLYDCGFNCRICIKCSKLMCDNYENICSICLEKQKLENLKELFETKDLQFTISSKCKCSEFDNIKLNLTNTKIIIDSDNIICLDSDSKEVKYKFKMTNSDNPESNFQFYHNLSGFTRIDNKIVLHSNTKFEYCKNCKCTGNGKCLNTHKKLYECEFNCQPVKCNICRSLIEYCNILEGCCSKCLEERRKILFATMHLANLLKTKNCKVYIKSLCSKFETQLDLTNTKLVFDYNYNDLNIDLACLDSENKIKYTFQFIVDKSMNNTMPEPWFQIDITSLLGINVVKNNTLTLYCKN